MKNLIYLILGLVLLPYVNAAPIVFIYTGSGSGSIGETSFINSNFTITQESDTNEIQSCEDEDNCIVLESTSANILLDGIGSFEFITGTRTFENGGYVGFSRAPIFGLDLYSPFALSETYNLSTPIGPIHGMPTLGQWDTTDVLTDGGVLSFNMSVGNYGTFEAVSPSAIPLPAGIYLFLSGLIGLVLIRNKAISTEE